MGKIYDGSAPLSKVYDVSINAPLDNRIAVRYVADLTTGENGGIAAQVYKGMIVYVQEDNSLYIYTGQSNNKWKTSTGKLVNGGDINNWKKVDSFLDPSVNLQYYAEKIGAKIFETEDELTGTIDSAYRGMFAVVTGDSDETTVEETGLYILLDDDNTNIANWMKIDSGNGDYVTRDELDEYLKKNELPDFLTDSDLDGYVKVEDLDGYLKPEDIADLASKSDLDGYVKVQDALDFLTDSDLDGYATEQWVENQGYLKEHQSLDGYATEQWVENKGYLTEHQDLSDYAKHVDLIDFLTNEDLGDYVKREELTPYLTAEDIEDLAAKSDLDGYVKKEDALEYLTASDLDIYATKSYVDKKITDLVGGAPETLDTLKEIAEALEDNATMQMVSDAISTKANSADVYKKNEVYTKAEVDVKIDALPDEGTFPEIGDSEAEFNDGLATVGGVIDYVADAISEAAPDLSGFAEKSEIPTKVSDLANDAGYITEHQDLSDYATKDEIPTVPENVSEFTNDAGYLTEHQSLEDYATKDYVDIAIATVPEHSEVITTDGTQPTSGSGISVSDNSENAFVEEVYVDDYLHAGIYYTSKGIASSDKNGGSELEGVGHIVLSNGGNSWIKINSRGVMTVLIEDDSLGFNAENIVGLISNDHEYINPYEGHAYPGSRLTFSLGGGDMIKFNIDVDFTGFTEVRDDESEEYIFGQTGSNYEDIDFYSVNVLPTVNAYVDGVSTRVLTEGDKLELANMIDEKSSIQPISNQEILNLFI